MLDLTQKEQEVLVHIMILMLKEVPVAEVDVYSDIEEVFGVPSREMQDIHRKIKESQ